MMRVSAKVSIISRARCDERFNLNLYRIRASLKMLLYLWVVAYVAGMAARIALLQIWTPRIVNDYYVWQQIPMGTYL